MVNNHAHGVFFVLLADALCGLFYRVQLEPLSCTFIPGSVEVLAEV